MDEYISKQKVIDYLNGYLHSLGEGGVDTSLFDCGQRRALINSIQDILAVKAADVQPVGRCKDCMYFKPAHVRCADGSEKAYSEFPEEAFEPNFGLGVTSDYGINIGSQCAYDEWCGGYSDDKTVFRKEDDFCSRFKSGARTDLKDGDSKC